MGEGQWCKRHSNHGGRGGIAETKEIRVDGEECDPWLRNSVKLVLSGGLCVKSIILVILTTWR